MIAAWKLLAPHLAFDFTSTWWYGSVPTRAPFLHPSTQSYRDNPTISEKVANAGDFFGLLSPYFGFMMSHNMKLKMQARWYLHPIECRYCACYGSFITYGARALRVLRVTDSVFWNAALLTRCPVSQLCRNRWCLRPSSTSSDPEPCRNCLPQARACSRLLNRLESYTEWWHK